MILINRSKVIRRPVAVILKKPFATEVFAQPWTYWLTDRWMCVRSLGEHSELYIYIWSIWQRKQAASFYSVTAGGWHTAVAASALGANTPFMWKPRPPRVLSTRPSSGGGGRAIGTVRLQRGHSHTDHTHTHCWLLHTKHPRLVPLLSPSGWRKVEQERGGGHY